MLHKKSLDFSSIKYLLIFNKPGPYRKDWLMEMKMKILKTLILIPFFMFGKSVLADTTISLGAGVQQGGFMGVQVAQFSDCLLYTSPSPRDGLLSRMPSSA